MIFKRFTSSILQRNWRKVQNRFCLEGSGERVMVGARGRNDPNNVCTCE
jgi:hypothetical protein